MSLNYSLIRHNLLKASVRHKYAKKMSEELKEQQDATNLDEEQNLDQTSEEDIAEEGNVTLTQEEYEELYKKAEQFPNIVARAKKTEAELKALKAVKAEVTPNVTSNQTLDSDAVDVKILQSQGLSEELIEQLKKLAKVNGTSILAAQSDPIYKLIKEQKEKEQKSQDASMGASRGSGSSKAKKGFNSPGLSDEEHRAMWRAEQGR